MRLAYDEPRATDMMATRRAGLSHLASAVRPWRRVLVIAAATVLASAALELAPRC